MALVRFLAEGKARLHGHEGAVAAVLGNESADLDSIVSAIVYANALRSIVQLSEGTVVVPVINVAKADFPLCTEAVFALAQAGVGPEHLVFVDEIDLQQLASEKRLDVFLVDHNVLSQRQQFLAPCVRGIVDHHEYGGKFNELQDKKIALVGSCTTLVAQKVFESNSTDALSDPEAALLLVTILVDTVNLDRSKGRTTDEDEAVAAQLRGLVARDMDEFYQRTCAAKFEVSHLSVSELLRKDYKQRAVNGHRVGVACIGMPLADLELKDNFESSLMEFLVDRRLHVLVVMTLIVEPEFQRQVLLFAPRQWYLSGLQQALEGPLQLEPLQLQRTNWPAFNQKEIKSSRKVVLPLVEKYLESVPCVRIVAVTGGIGSGKSTVCKLLKEKHGYEMINADHLGHESYAPGSPVLDQLAATFGTDIVQADGTLDRKALGKIVFSDKSQLEKLNDIVWPAIAKLFAVKIQGLTHPIKDNTVVLEAAVLLEAGWDAFCDQVWVCSVPRQVTIERLVGRGLTKEEAEKRMASQMPQEEREKKASAVVTNAGTEQDLEATVDRLVRHHLQ